ncbi:MAG: metallophosphoesterase [Cyclobacteriaceae bacterium]
MVDGPYIFWESEEDYIELNFHYDGSEFVLNKAHKNLDEHPEIEIEFNKQKVKIPLRKKFAPPNSHYQKAEKIIAFGDIHGEFDKLVQLLIAHQIIDEQFNWTFARGHLVFCGDIFDRGKQVTECLWLIYHLEQQAASFGGCVHYLLGNHEIMSLTGDLRYLQQKYKLITASALLEYKDLFNRESELGRWLRNRNMVVTINDLLFVHAGLAPSIKQNIENLNHLIRAYLNGDDQHFYFINDPYSPIWYRGYMYAWQGTAKVSQNEMENILQHYGIKKIIFAHTEVDRITPLYQQSAIAIDVPFKKHAQALLIKDNEFYQLDEMGRQQKLF